MKSQSLSSLKSPLARLPNNRILEYFRFISFNMLLSFTEISFFLFISVPLLSEPPYTPLSSRSAPELAYRRSGRRRFSKSYACFLFPEHYQAFCISSIESLIDLMHIIFRNAKDSYDSRSLVEIEHGWHGFDGYLRIFYHPCQSVLSVESVFHPIFFS